jgi:hypothetical protein
MMARFLQVSGINMGDSVLGSGIGNEHGHFEDTEILAFHQKLLEQTSGTEMWAGKPPTVNDADRELAAALLQRKSKECPWGWKEPRTALFLNLWNELAPNARFLFMVRSPAAVVDSLDRRFSRLFPDAKTQRSRWRRARDLASYFYYWLVFNKEILKFSRRYPEKSCVVFLDDISRRPEHELPSISQFLGIPLEPACFKSHFVEQSMHRGRNRFPAACMVERHIATSFHHFMRLRFSRRRART